MTPLIVEKSNERRECIAALGGWKCPFCRHRVITADMEQCACGARVLNAPASEWTYCLSLTQPWATLVAIGAKAYETRGWSTKYRGTLAIHATKSFPLDCRELCHYEPFISILTAAGFNNLNDLPLGKVLAVVDLVDCIATDTWMPDPASNEYAFGNYEPGRFAWKLDNVHALARPFDARGFQLLWKLPRKFTAEDFA